MNGLELEPGLLVRLRAQADQPPRVARLPLWAGDARIGSVEPDWARGVALRPECVERITCDGQEGWIVRGDITASLGAIAFALRDAGAAHAWRDEQLAVTDESGTLLGTVERAVVRPLGIATRAVHLVGFSPDGRHWVQQRSLTKPNDPGRWDTLMGGMIPACDSVDQALERETWEEAGLRIAQLRELKHGGRVAMRCHTESGRGGYVVEHIEWYRCVVPDGVVPQNQDGEVERFELLAPDEVAGRIARDAFTLEAALVLAACAGL
ncbi:MAG: NUDIX domain-containing protein [Pseudomonadota bacterium]